LFASLVRRSFIYACRCFLKIGLSHDAAIGGIGCRQTITGTNAHPTNDCYCKSEWRCINLIAHGSYAKSNMTSAVLLAITPFAGTPNVAN
jgi:hypothetical protein